MLAVGPLMVEHRLIENVVALLGREAVAVRSAGKADVLFVERAVDFFEFYADRGHHGKEEGILFREIARKPLTPELRKIMQDLAHQHVAARQAVAKIARAGVDARHGNPEAVAALAREMEALAIFYPRHIELEEKTFFLGCMPYFSEEESAAILREFERHDGQLLQEKYKSLYVQLMREDSGGAGA